jgi:hypothetical protein
MPVVSVRIGMARPILVAGLVLVAGLGGMGTTNSGR